MVGLFTKDLPITLKLVASPGWAARAKPEPALTNLSPLLMRPVTFTGTRPVIATGGWVSFSPAPPFMVYAGLVLMTPNTFSLNSFIDLVISFNPPSSTTVPDSNCSSASNRSATSAYNAVVAVAKTWLK